MNKKIIFDLIDGILDIAQNSESNENENINNEETINVTISDDFSEINMLHGKKIRFKTNNPTYFWNSNDNFGSDIDTVFIVSKNGEPVENYYDIQNLSGIIFEYDDRFFESHDSVNNNFNNLYGITDLQIEELENGIYSRHIKGETDNFYLEVYCMKYNNINYAIELNIYKNNYSVNEINDIISEYNTIINTLEVIN